MRDNIVNRKGVSYDAKTQLQSGHERVQRRSDRIDRPVSQGPQTLVAFNH